MIEVTFIWRNGNCRSYPLRDMPRGVTDSDRVRPMMYKIEIIDFNALSGLLPSQRAKLNDILSKLPLCLEG